MFSSIINFFKNLFKKQPTIEPPKTEPTMKPVPINDTPNTEPPIVFEGTLLQLLVDTYKKKDIEFNHLKTITLAQWLLESGRGKSELAIGHLNFAGLKWRKEMEGYATPVSYKAHDGRTEYCKFESISKFIEGYWKFIDRSPYNGWRNNIHDGEAYLKFIVRAGYCPDNGYVDSILKLVNEAEKLLNSVPEADKEPTVVDEEVENEGERDNEETDLESKPEVEFESDKGEKLLYYPEAIKYKDEMRTRGKYSKRYPIGAVVHFTAGRGRRKLEGGSRAKDTHLEMGEKSVKSALRKNSYCYFVIDRDGNIHQPFRLDRWGYHAGESRWPGVGSSVSNDLVGIEVQCAGKVKPVRSGDFQAYFTNTSKGDKYFKPEEVREITKRNDNQQRGYYHKYSDKQEVALQRLLIWLKYNNPDVFKFDFVLGHDEVAGKKGIGRDRKNDPGGAMSMTMTQLRMKLITDYNKKIK